MLRGVWKLGNHFCLHNVIRETATEIEVGIIISFILEGRQGLNNAASSAILSEYSATFSGVVLQCKLL